MHRSLLPLLVDPEDRQPLRLEADLTGSADEVLTGRLVNARTCYAIRNGIPRFVLTDDPDQRQTEASFGFKWQQRDTYGAPGMMDVSRRWLVSRYGFESADAMRRYMAERGRVLDAGCGSGFSSSLWLSTDWDGALWVGVDISEAIDVARERLGAVPNTHFVQGDLLQLPFDDASFDVVISEGVLHHTPSTERAFKALVRLLRPGGEVMAYVYRKKGPVREFTDDFIRERLSALPPEEAWAQLRPLTRLGESLASLHAEVTVAEDIPLLGIRAGRYDIQRLVYWSFAKCFWNPAFTFEENNHVNFDWYHPRYAHRHTAEQLRQWCADETLTLMRLDEQESGFTLRAARN